MRFAASLAAATWQATAPPKPIAAIATETQVVSNWCWLAVTVTVDRLHGGTATQCALADRLLRESTCCRSPASSACNCTGRVETALQAVGRHTRTVALPAPPDYNAVRNDLNQRRPPVAQFDFTGGGSHVVLLAGHGMDGAGRRFIRVGDPARGWNPSDVLWAQARHYRGGVTWTHVCRTRP